MSKKLSRKLPLLCCSLCAFYIAFMCYTFPHDLPTIDKRSLRTRRLDYGPPPLPMHGEGHTPPPPTPSDESVVTLDFFVAGFPKCGTTTLLKTFDAHNETSVHPAEECSLARVSSDDIAYTGLMTKLNEASLDPNVKHGIKCPFGLSTPTAIQRLQDWFPNTKLIFGLRHPVFYFQSFYNYRVLEVHQNKLQGPIPPPELLIGSNDWIRVSTETARFEKTLKMLGKTTSDDSPPTPFKVFLYTLEQMEDENEARERNWRETLGSFLELKHEIQPLKAANVNRHQGEEGFDETINICDTKYDALRRVLVTNGRKSQRWILEKFLQSPDVIVANKEHFRETLTQWGSDPCVKVESQMDK